MVKKETLNSDKLIVTSIGNKFSKALLMAVAGGLLFVVFITDVIRRSVDLDIGWILLLRDIVILIAFLIFYVLVESIWKREQAPAKKLGFALVLTLVIGITSVLLFFISPSGFEIKNLNLIPLGFDSIVWSNVYGIVLSITMLIVLLVLRDIIFSKRRRGTKRNFIILLILIIASSLLTLIYRPMESGSEMTVLFIVTVIAMLMNSFRVSWIVYLSKREKILNIIFGFLLFCIFIGFDIITAKEGTIVGSSILFYSAPLHSFVLNVSLFATIYFGMTFISTLFHLPTAEAFDRKLSEVSSLHNLSRLVTQVFDFNELVDSVTTMTLEVCEAKSAWLEIVQEQKTGNIPKRGTFILDENSVVMTVALKNISLEEVQTVASSGGKIIRKQILDGRKPIVIDSIKEDKRTQHLVGMDNKISSLAIVPLLSHENVIGILYATKDVEFGFDKDDVDVISAFADHAAIAIENSRLIEKSIERERLMREMMLAQEMQKKLLPQQVPQFPQLEIEALSTPAFEVGGDYYDFVLLNDNQLGVLVGDVSGKGVSAAFYMAEMKGIFQSLSKIYREPKDLLIQAQRTLIGTIDRKSFISVIYAIIDLETGEMKVARAGHCPMLFASNHHASYVQPTGLGLGMGSCEIFEKTITQENVRMAKGDIAVFYTDGVTEARPEDGSEFGYDKLKDVVKFCAGKSATEIRDSIIMAVDNHMNHASPEDDLTIVVLKWNK
ncbi:MAG: SpoIIE family protein phosphatase [Bacteroidota bacterium]|nr:SpoIIE family protein phosphatase [Bacteroidota bacterium]